MDQDRITYLCSRYLNSESTMEELLEFEFLLQDNQTAQLLKNALTEVYYKLSPDLHPPLSQERADTIFDRIVAGQRQGGGGLNWWRAGWTAAAAVFIISGLSILFLKQSKNQQSHSYMNTESISPGTEAATLTLSDGRRLKLSQETAGVLVLDGGMLINNTLDYGLIYSSADNSAGKVAPAGPVIYNTLSTGKGQQYPVRLPDSTLVWLNAASSLKYPATFAGMSTRNVELTGEAYFEVKRGKKQPFVVHTKGQEVKVLGTHFNLRSYEDDAASVTTLLEGAVEITAAGSVRKMLPGDRAVLTANGLRIGPGDRREEMAWRNGFFYFNDESIADVMRKLSRWYNVEVEYEDVVSDETFYGVISRNKDIRQILTILEQTKDVRFKVEGRRIVVMR